MKLSIYSFILFVALSLLAIKKANAANDPKALDQASKRAANIQCLDLRKASQKIPVYTANIQNREVTRTPEGGPYKRVEMVCHELYCETVAKDDFKFVYLPGHSDANSSGMVRMPVVNVATEFAAITSAAAEVRLLAGAGACGATALGSATTALVKYDAGASVQSDTFNYATDGRLTSWSRILRDGTAQHFAFASDGTILQ